MQRRFMCIVLLSFMICLCAGCNKDDLDEDITQNKTVDYIYDKTFKNISEGRRIAFSENGYYFITDDLLCFYDVYNDITIPICAKVDCEHQDENCDAYTSDEKCYNNYIWYENDKLYMIEVDQSGTYLVQYDSNYINEVKFCKLAEGDMFFDEHAKIYDGYLYYFCRKKCNIKEMSQVDYMEPKLCMRIKMEKDAKPECIGEFEWPVDLLNSNITANIIIGKECVYFMSGHYLRFYSPNTYETRLKIFKYDITDNSFSTVLDKKTDSVKGSNIDFLGIGTGDYNGSLANSCIDDEGNIYLVVNYTDIVKIESDGNIRVIYKGCKAPQMQQLTIVQLLWDGESIYFIEPQNYKGILKKIDKNGNVIGNYELEMSEEKLEQYIKDEKDAYIKGAELLGIDGNNIVLLGDSGNTKGLEAPELVDYNYNKDPYDKNYFVPSVGFIPKEALQDNSIPIKKIYEWKQ